MIPKREMTKRAISKKEQMEAPMARPIVPPILAEKQRIQLKYWLQIFMVYGTSI